MDFFDKRPFFPGGYGLIWEISDGPIWSDRGL